MIFVNFKTYQQGTGELALSLAKICAEVAKETGVQIIPIVQAVDIFRLASQGLAVWVQHVDNIEFGPNTGKILPEALIAAGVKGTLLNHSENKLSKEQVGSTIKRIQSLTINYQPFKVLVCAESIKEGQQIAVFKPNFLAYEPPELIGGTTSVSQAGPEIISEFVDKIKEIPILVGAGIHNQADVQKALVLGAKGVLVSSDIVLVDNPKQELLNLAEGFLS